MNDLIEKYKLYGEDFELSNVEFDDGVFLPGYLTGLLISDLTDDEIGIEINENIRMCGSNIYWGYILMDVLLQRRKRKIDKIKDRILCSKKEI